MPNIVSLQLTSPLSLAAAPFVVGQGFKKGQIPAGTYVTAGVPDIGVKPLATWNDGSLKHAMIFGRIATVAGAPSSITLGTTNTAPSGTKLTADDIAAAAPVASVQCGALGTVTLASLLSAPVRTWVSSPQMVECHYRADVPGTNLLVMFYVRLFAGGAIYVRMYVGNGYLDNGAVAAAVNADAPYVTTAIVGTNTVYSSGETPLNHCRNTDWMAEGWIGTDPQIIPRHDSAYLRATKLVPNYSLVTPNDQFLNGLIQSYVPMDNADIPGNMASGGANYTIGLVPAWDATYIGTSDPRAYKAMLASTDSLRSFAIVWRDFTTKDIIRPTTFPNWSTKGPNGSNINSLDLSNGCDWEFNHHPGIGYVAYLVTADYWHYETMLLQVSAFWAMRGKSSVSGYSGVGTSRVLVAECRGTAWGLRSMSQLCGLMPDVEKASGAIGNEYVQVLASNAAYWDAVRQRPSINGLGMLYEYSANAGLVNFKSPWQQFWWIQSMGFGSDLDPLPDMTAYNAVRNHVYKFIVGMVGDPTTGFPYFVASVYRAKVADGTTHDPELWYDSFRQVAEGTFAHLEGGVDSISSDPGKLLNGGAEGDPVPAIGGAGGVSTADTGRWGYLLPAIAYAAEHGAEGAAASWARIANASNYADLTNRFVLAPSQWGVFPRTIGESTLAHATGRSIRFGRLRPSRITLSKYHGNGAPKADISKGFPIPSLLENDVLPGDPDDTEYRIDVPEMGLNMKIYEDSSFEVINPPDGTHTSTPKTYKNGVPTDTPLTFIVGVGSGAAVPDIPTNVVATAGNGTVSINCTAPANNGSPITGYQAVASTGQTIISATLPIQMNMPNGTPATFRVRAINAIGSSPLSDPSNEVTPATVPGAPTNVSVMIGFNRATVNFNPPANDGGSPILNYRVIASTGHTATKNSTPIDISLPNGVSITVAVAAINAIGEGAPSAQSEPFIVTAPSADVTVQIVPNTVVVEGGKEIQLTAVVTEEGNIPAQDVTWYISAGSITQDGLATAPPATILAQTVTATAISDVNPSRFAIATIVVPSINNSEPEVTTPIRNYDGNITNKYGAAIEGASVEVFDSGTNLKAVLWADQNKTTELTNPVVTDTEGYFQFFVEAEQCFYTVTGPTIEPYERRNIFDVVNNVDLTALSVAVLQLQSTLSTLPSYSQMQQIQISIQSLSTRVAALENTLNQ